MYQRTFQSWLKHLDFILLDLLCLHLSFLAGYLIRNGLESPYLIPTYRNMAIVCTLIQLIVVIFLWHHEKCDETGLLEGALRYAEKRMSGGAA